MYSCGVVTDRGLIWTSRNMSVWFSIILTSSASEFSLRQYKSSYHIPALLKSNFDLLKIYYFASSPLWRARGGAVGWGTVLQAGRSRVRFPVVSINIFHWHNPSVRTMALGSTQPLTEMSTRNISWGGKGGRCEGLTTLPPSCAVVMKSGILILLEHSEVLQASNGIALPFTLYIS